MAKELGNTIELVHDIASDDTQTIELSELALALVGGGEAVVAV